MGKTTEKTKYSDLLTTLIAQDILTSSSSQPIYLSSVEVIGGETFSSDFFKKLLGPLVETSDYTLNQLVENITVSRDRLVKADVFKSIGVSLHSDYSASIPHVLKYNKDQLIPTKVIFDVEASNLNAGDGFLNLNNDDNLNVNLNYLNDNFNENAESVNFGVNYNPYKPNQHLIANAKFLANLNDPSLKFLFDLFNTHQNNQTWQQASEKTTGGLIGLQYTNRIKNLYLLTGLSLAKRTIHDIRDGAPDELKYFSGDYLKSSIVNQLVYSNVSFLNNITKNFPISGYNVTVSSEISSNQEQDNIDHQTGFGKSTISTNLFTSFANNNFTAHLFNDFGGIYSPSSNSVHVSDRFYLGGFNSFRGFSKNSINTTGGSQFFKLGLTLYAKVPSFIYSSHKNAAANIPSLEDGIGYEANPLRIYTTGSVGNVSNNILLDKSVASSIGCGLKYINHWANFDIGYYLAQRHGSDSLVGIKDGFQFSVSIGGSNRTVQ